VMEADGTKKALDLFRCTEIRCSKKTAGRFAGAGRKRFKRRRPGAVEPRPAVRGWALLGAGQFSKNI